MYRYIQYPTLREDRSTFGFRSYAASCKLGGKRLYLQLDLQWDLCGIDLPDFLPTPREMVEMVFDYVDLMNCSWYIRSFEMAAWCFCDYIVDSSRDVRFDVNGLSVEVGPLSTVKYDSHSVIRCDIDFSFGIEGQEDNLDCRLSIEIQERDI